MIHSNLSVVLDLVDTRLNKDIYKKGYNFKITHFLSEQWSQFLMGLCKGFKASTSMGAFLKIFYLTIK